MLIETDNEAYKDICHPASNDIACVFSGDVRNIEYVKKLNDLEKKKLMTEHWMPDSSFKYPYTMKGGKNPQKVYLGLQHLSGGSYSSFKFSPSLNGLLCVTCVLFANEVSENNHSKDTKLAQLVNKPLRKYSHLTGSDGQLTNHLSNQYHKNSVVFGDHFLLTMNTGTNIKIMLNGKYKAKVKESRERLVPIIKTVMLCGRLGVAYRGRRDDGNVSLETNDGLIKADVNFKALLAYRLDAGDKVLEHHLKSSGKNATCISKTVQNELIDICGQVITEKIIKEAKIAKYFSVIADKTADVSHLEQLCVCIRFVCLINGFHTIREEFLNFKKANDLSGKGLGELIIQTLKGHSLNLTYLVGQGYDGASAMSGCYNGVQEHVRKVAPSAVFVHCSSRVLNLVLNSTCSVPEIRDMFSTVKKCTTFINDSIIRREILQKFLQDSESSVSCLKSFSETRFVERHDCLLIFYQNFINIVKCLEEIVNKLDSKTVDTARSLLRCLYDPVVIVALCCAKKVMALTVTLSKLLQTVNNDLIGALNAINFVKKLLLTWGCDENEIWMNADFGLFNNANYLANALNIALVTPRAVCRQLHRNNIPAENACQYYKRATWFLYLDSVIQSMDARFSNHQQLVMKMSALLPSVISQHSWNDVVETVRMFSSVIGYRGEETIHNEYLEWKEFCSHMQSYPSTLLAALDQIPDRYNL
ncbi:52 kDa repressor of the inhibitor of the protein kinase-like [Hydra vulgaris]|uniref:52 kDa repressor of the inhibitor of the protein kinase-like n=1 Tax=Hydra vulgaris TaxID=6087 RepID=A0ABM4BZ95_HYDVU